MCLIRHHTDPFSWVNGCCLQKKRCKGIAFPLNLQHFSKKKAKKGAISWYSRHFTLPLHRNNESSLYINKV